MSVDLSGLGLAQILCTCGHSAIAHEEDRCRDCSCERLEPDEWATAQALAPEWEPETGDAW
jgi:hypothetical protein